MTDDKLMRELMNEEYSEWRSYVGGDCADEESFRNGWIAAIRTCASECQKAIVAACPACEGHGVTTVVITGPDGPMQDLDRCEYCGRPCDAIRERFGVEK